jgi:AcrR family transcriptional regulator
MLIFQLTGFETNLRSGTSTYVLTSRYGETMTQHQDRDTRREQILESALKLFISKGYENSTVDEIAEQAGLSKGSIYWYFKSKLEILFELTDRFMAGGQQLLVKLIESEGYGTAALYKAHREIYEFTMQSSQRQLVYQLDTLAGTYPEIRERLVAYHRGWDETISQQINNAIQQGDFRAVNAQHVAQAINALYDGLCMRSRMEPDMDVVATIETVTRLIYEGLTKHKSEPAISS